MAKLEEYRRKRHFDRTPEPEPAASPGAQDGVFVVQKHAATRLHYDFRLAIDGVLKSWAVPKGPSLNPADKRLAVQTEDHPIDYANFEGNIPKGNYGAGSVMVWDRGTFSAEGNENASRQWARGEIKFNLQGEKLRGSFVIVRLRRGEKKNEWLMIKHQDDAADPKWNIDEHEGSALTGRNLEEIAEELPANRHAVAMKPSELQGAHKAAMPSRVSPMLATPTGRAFSDPEWLFEIKWDGARTLAWLEDGKVRLRSRTQNDVTGRYPELAVLSHALRAKSAVVDGEIVVLDKDGRSNFEWLQQRMNVRTPSPQALLPYPATYYVFDLLYCDGYDLRGAPLSQRKELLRLLLRSSDAIRFSDHQAERGAELFALAEKKGLEGIIGKRADSGYVSARSKDWVKLKTTKTLDAVIGGWTAPRGGRVQIGSLLLGLYEGKNLRFIGHAGSGLSDKALKDVAKELVELQTERCPFDRVPKTNEKAFWAKPARVARVRFQGWTQEARMRAPVFLGLRDDVHTEDCKFESEVPAEAAADAASGVRDDAAADAGREKIPKAPSVSRSNKKSGGEELREEAQIAAELLQGKREEVTIDLDGKKLRLTHLNKVFFPGPGYTKRDLLGHYLRTSRYILPFLKDRPLVLRRYPNGIQGEAFFQKDARDGVPPWLETVAVESEGKREQVRYMIANDLAALLYLTNLGCIDHNPWSSRRDDLEHPDYLFFDLDPSDGTDFSTVITIARALHEKITELGLKVFLKTSGATGFHLYLPVERVYTYEQLRMFGEIVAQLVFEKHSELITRERIVAQRRPGQVLIDVSQNGLGRPLAAAYSVRAFPEAPVSTPVLPAELRPSLRPEKHNLKTIVERLAEKGDLWAEFWNSRQRIEDAIERLQTSGGLQTRGRTYTRNQRKKA